MRLDKEPWSARKLTLRTVKHAIWVAIAVATGGAWIFYFADAPTLLVDFFTGHAEPVAYMTVAVLTATTYTFGGLMREQVCTYMCPWPRIQAAMLDENSLTVTYNDWRGEPRVRGTKKAMASGVAAGDCVDCNACVVVCPMGIDIRDGQQLECITCALCIDACDDVMGRLGRDRGLISYATLADYNANMAVVTGGGSHAIDPTLVRKPDGSFADGITPFRLSRIFQPRVFIYFAGWALIGVALIYALMVRDRLELNVLHDRNPQFVVLSDGSIRNGYTVKLLNKIAQPRTVTVALDGLPGGEMSVIGMDYDASRSFAVALEPDRLRTLKIYVRQPRDLVDGRVQSFRFLVDDAESGENTAYTAKFDAPE
jgi:cytochrome c oxidase accessory protein FixG